MTQRSQPTPNQRATWADVRRLFEDFRQQVVDKTQQALAKRVEDAKHEMVLRELTRSIYKQTKQGE